MIIGLVGFINAGKGTAGDILVKMGFTKQSFAGPLKDAASAIFGWDRQMLEGDTPESREWRELPDEFWSNVMGRPFSPREALQKLGTEAGRNVFHPDVWVEALKRRCKGDTVITDVRFQNEMEFIRKNNGIVIHIQRGELPDWYNVAEKANKGNKVALIDMKNFGIHESEWKWIGGKIDATIKNNGTLEDLKDTLHYLIKYGIGVDHEVVK